jgi:VRR-NUC domain
MRVGGGAHGGPAFRLTEALKREHELQADLGDALAVLLVGNAVFNSWDLANSRSAIEGALKKRRHCLPGWPDCSVWWDGRVVLLELKRRDGTLSETQRALHVRLAAAGHDVSVCRSVPEALQALREAGVPLRGRVMA